MWIGQWNKKCERGIRWQASNNYLTENLGSYKLIDLRPEHFRRLYTKLRKQKNATQAGGREAHEQSPIRGEQYGFHGLLTHWIIVECRKDM